MSDTVTHRELRLSDAAAVTEVLAIMELVEPIDEALSETDVIEEMTVPGVELARSGIALLDGDRLVGFGWLRVSPPSASWKAVVWAGLLPDYRGRGIGQRIITEIEARAEIIRAADAPGAPGELKVWVEPERAWTTALVAAAGYRTWRYFFRMRRDLAEPVVSVPIADGVQIRTYRPADDEAVRLASNQSFADHWGSTPMDSERWRAEFADSTAFWPEQSLLAVTDDRVVGFVLSEEFEADTEHRGYPTGYLARVGALRSVRGRGIASALIAQTLERLRSAGYRYAELSVDAESPTGAGRLYERAGFVTIGRNSVVGKHF